MNDGIPTGGLGDDAPTDLDHARELVRRFSGETEVRYTHDPALEYSHGIPMRLVAHEPHSGKSVVGLAYVRAYLMVKETRAEGRLLPFKDVPSKPEEAHRLFPFRQLEPCGSPASPVRGGVTTSNLRWKKSG